MAAAKVVCSETWNFTDEIEAYENLTVLQWSGTDKLIITIIVPIICTIGILANLAFLFTVARVRRMQIVTNYYLVNLGVADIVFMALTLGLYVNSYRYSPLRHNVPYQSSLGCWGTIYPFYLSYYTSILLVTLVAVERFFMICMPIKYRLIKGKSRTVKMIAACWGVSLVLAALTTPRYGWLKHKCIVWPNTDDFRNVPVIRSGCYYINNEVAIFGETLLTVVLILSLLISGFMYYKLIETLSKRPEEIVRRRSSIRSARREENKTRRRNEVARILIINGIVFFLCQFPARLIGVDRLIRLLTDTKQDHSATIFAVANGLLLINSAINPFIYGLSSRFYRVAFCEAFGIATFLRMERSTSLMGGSSFTLSQSLNDASVRIRKDEQDADKRLSLNKGDPEEKN